MSAGNKPGTLTIRRLAGRGLAPSHRGVDCGMAGRADDHGRPAFMVGAVREPPLRPANQYTRLRGAPACPKLLEERLLEDKMADYYERPPEIRRPRTAFPWGFVLSALVVIATMMVVGAWAFSTF